MEQGNGTVVLAKGFLNVFGQGKCVVGKREFPLSQVMIEKCETDANEYAVAHITNISPIKYNRKRGGKVHFKLNNVWDSTRFCRDGRMA